MTRRRLRSGLRGGLCVVGSFTVLGVLVHWHLTRDGHASDTWRTPFREPERPRATLPQPEPTGSPGAPQTLPSFHVPSPDAAAPDAAPAADPSREDTPPTASVSPDVVHVTSPGEAIDDLTERVRAHLRPR